MKLCNFSLTGEARSPELERLRNEVREFLARERDGGAYSRTPAGWDRYDPAFSRKLGAMGWIGMTWPSPYGGHERSFLERYVVTEELLAAGAPVRAHWLADRQIGPLLLAVGTEAQKRRYLPRIAAGECFFCVGLSEPDSGSDLASIRTKAQRTEGGWRINGAKIWTSYAHMAHMMNLFARTSPRTDENRHQGVTQFLVDLKSPGITINPIYNLAGDHDFNEVVFDDVLLPEDAVIGAVDQGWSQVTGELAHERSGPERWLNAYGALVEAVDLIGTSPTQRQAESMGRLVSRIWTLHHMSFSIAGMLERGEKLDMEAALVKDLGTHFDQEVPAAVRSALPADVRGKLPDEHPFSAMQARAELYAPSHTIRGGTQEVLRGIIARGLGLR